MIQKVRLTTREGKKVMGCQVTVTSSFRSNIGSIWDKIQDVNILREICKPKVCLISCDDSPMSWKKGKSLVFKSFLHGFLPAGRHMINAVKMDKAARETDTEEYNDTVIIWSHYIRMEEVSQQATRYTDTIDLYAGCFTSIAAWWTLKFHKYRQCKWQIITKSL